MAKKGSYRRSRGGLGGLVQPLMFGGLAGFLSRKLAPQVVPYQGPLAGAATAGALKGMNLPKMGAGAIGGLIGDRLAGGSTSGGSAEW